MDLRGATLDAFFSRLFAFDCYPYDGWFLVSCYSVSLFIGTIRIVMLVVYLVDFFFFNHFSFFFVVVVFISIFLRPLSHFSQYLFFLLFLFFWKKNRKE